MSDDQHRRIGDDRLESLIASHQDVRMQLAKVENELKNMQGNQEHVILLIQRSLDRHEQQLNGFNGVPGVRMETDRLKNTLTAWQRHIWAIWIVLVGIVGKWVEGWITR